MYHNKKLTRSFKRGGCRYIHGCLYKHIPQTAFILDCHDSGNTNINTALCQFDGSGAIDNTPSGMTTIYVHDARKQVGIMSLLSDLAIEIEKENKLLSQCCWKNTGDLGKMYSLGVTTTTKCPTHMDKRYLDMNALWYILLQVCSMITTCILFSIAKNFVGVH